MGEITQPWSKNMSFLKLYKNKNIFCFALFLSKHVDKWLASVGSIVQRLVNYPVVVSYPQQWHIWCKLLLCYYNLDTHVVFHIFLCRTLNNFSKLIVKSVMVFSLKSLPFYFSNALKSENLQGIREILDHYF